MNSGSTIVVIVFVYLKKDNMSSVWETGCGYCREMVDAELMVLHMLMYSRAI